MTEPRARGNEWMLAALPALTVLFGVQTLRVLFPLWVFVLRDRLDWSAAQVGLLGLALFAGTLLAIPLKRALGARRLVALSVGGLAAARVILQLWHGEPLVDLVIATLGALCFLLFFPPYLALMRAQQELSSKAVVLGLLFGFMLDAALHGAYRTLDLAWHGDPYTLMVVIALAAALLWLATRLSHILPDGHVHGADTRIGLALTWAGFGLCLFLELLIFANPARLTALTGWQPPAALLWLLVAQALSITLVVLLPGAWVNRRLTAAATGALLIIAVWDVWATGWNAAISLLVGQCVAALLLAMIAHGIELGQTHRGITRLAFGHALGMVLFMLISFMFYAGYDIQLPFANVVWPPVAATLLALGALVAVNPSPGQVRNSRHRQPVLAALVLLAIPLLMWARWQSPTAVAGDGGPVRVVNYNVHNGFDPDGRLSIAAIADAIEAEDPDIVLLQEVTRGWVIDGSLDMMAWLAQRLEMGYVYGPTADALFGNAMLSRYPILDSELHDLPTENLLLQRGFIRATVDAGGEPLDVIVTHYHHPEEGGDIRKQQSQSILDQWQAKPRTILAGDLNAEPDAPEIEMLVMAGFQDVWELTSTAPGFTYPARVPDRRIDYILLSPDLSVSAASVPPVDASDHLPVVATVHRE